MKKLTLLFLFVLSVSSTIWSQQPQSGPLVVVDGKIKYVDVHSIDGQTIESVVVLKDREAIFAYGEAGRNGVVLVSTNNPAQPVNTDSSEPKPLVIVDGKVSYEPINSISPSNIESLTVLKGLQANNAWGEAGKDGVIIVKLK